THQTNAVAWPFVESLVGRLSLRMRGLFRGWREREKDHELAPLAVPLAPRLDGPAVEMDEIPHQGEPDPKTAASAAVPSVDLGEHVEDPLQHLGRDSDPVVLHRDADGSFVGFDGEPDPTAWARVLRGVVEQVREDLCQSDGIGE